MATNPTPQSVLIPVGDGVTIKEVGGVLSEVPQGAANVAYANGVLTVNGVAVTKLSLTELDLTGGVTEAAGNYLTTFDAAGNETFTPYVPATGGPAAAGAAYAVNAPAQAIYAVAWLPVPGLTVQKGQTWSVTPVFAGAPNPATLNYLMVQAFVNSAGAMYLRVSNSSAIPAMSYTVTVK